MRVAVCLLCLVVPTLLAAQQREAVFPSHVPLERYRFVKGASADIDASAAIRLNPYTVRSGDTLEAILEARGIQSSLRARALVLEVNPGLMDSNRIREGMTLVVPEVDAASGRDRQFAIGSPDSVRRTHETALALSERARSVENAQASLALGRFSSALERSADLSVGMSAQALSAWNDHAEALARIAASPDGGLLAAELAAEAADGLEQTMAYARSGQATYIPVSVLARDAPDQANLASCRIRYAYWGYAYRGHEVSSDHSMDFSASACSRGQQLLAAWIPHGIWAEWREGPTLRRSAIKKVTVKPDLAWEIDLPLQPFE